jgi:outer membrane cobalamin receptor
LAQDGAINKLNTNGVKSPEPLRYTSLTALSMQYKRERFKLTGSLVATYITDEVRNGTTPKDRSKLSPAVLMSYRLLQEKQLYVRAMYKNTFRVPTFSDLYYLRVGNTNLKPENATEYSVGLTWSGESLGLDYISITTDGYYNRVSDKIIAFPSTYVWKMQNYGEVDIYGADVTAAVGFKAIDKVNINLSANYSWQKAIDVTDSNAKNYKHQLPYTPEHSGNAAVTIEMPWVNIGYSIGIVGKRYYMAQNIEVNEIKEYNEHTATIWREFSMKDVSLRLQAEIINLTDAHYEIIKYYPMPGRTWRLTGIFKF